MKIINQLKYVVPIILALVVLLMCNPKASHPGLEYMPDMFHSQAYETYTYSGKERDFKQDRVAMTPVEGTIPVNHQAYHTPNTPEGYEEAIAMTENPVELNEEVLLRGKQIYTIHCTPCHGEKGDGEGSAVVGSEYRLAPPPIKFDNPTPGYLTAGRMFHTITYGKGNMGSYASQVSPEDRWKVIHYIESLNKANKAAADEEGSADAEEETDTNEEG